jgi:hypothetical protein
MESKLRQRFASAMPMGPTATTGTMTSRSSVFPLSGMGEDWIEVGPDSDVQLVDKEVQTDEKLLEASAPTSETVTSKSDTVRSVEECLSIYRSEVSFTRPLIAAKLRDYSSMRLAVEAAERRGPKLDQSILAYGSAYCTLP